MQHIPDHATPTCVATAMGELWEATLILWSITAGHSWQGLLFYTFPSSSVLQFVKRGSDRRTFLYLPQCICSLLRESVTSSVEQKKRYTQHNIIFKEPPESSKAITNHGTLKQLFLKPSLRLSMCDVQWDDRMCCTFRVGRTKYKTRLE